MNYSRSIALVAWLVTPTAVSSAACSAWDAGGEWSIKQNNGPEVKLTVQQDGSTLTGTAHWIGFTGETTVFGILVQGSDPEMHEGTLDGTIEGDRIDLQIYWTADGQIGAYTGKVGPRGRVEGDTHDRQNPGSSATWFSSSLLPCAPSPAPPVAKPAPVSGPPANGALPDRPGAAELKTSPDIVTKPPGVVTTKSDPAGIVPNRPGAAPSVTSEVCEQGFVWREARPGDVVCVAQGARDEAAQQNAESANHTDPAGAHGPNTCMQGYVWREAFDGDKACVTPEARDLARQQNAEGGSHRADSAGKFRDPR